jgi:transcriptional regulator with XRE-family HTH domain
MVGQNIRDARTGQGMSQETLSLLSGVTRNVLIDVEHGRRGLLYERIYDLAKALQVPIDRLLGEQGRG